MKALLLPSRRRGGRFAAVVVLAWVWAVGAAQAEPLVRDLPEREPSAERVLRSGGRAVANPLSVVIPAGRIDPIPDPESEVRAVSPVDEVHALALILLIPSGLYYFDKSSQQNIFLVNSTGDSLPRDSVDTDRTDRTDSTDSHHANETPEPGSLVLGLLGLAFGGAAALRRRYALLSV